jgi:hypothetical protein
MQASETERLRQQDKQKGPSLVMLTSCGACFNCSVMYGNGKCARGKTGVRAKFVSAKEV